MKITICAGDAEYTLPAKYEVCDRCEGKGTHTNPSIDGNGISSDEMRELGDEFMEGYMRGVYDVQCHECNGQRVIVVPDEERLTEEELKAVHQHYEEEAAIRAERAAELKYGY